MEGQIESGRLLHTGLFQVDLGNGQVHKGGRRLPVQEQPFRVLAMLLERPGEVVTRQELQSRLWPADTYVGFDEGLNTAIRKLRTVFGDSAINPRFIETLPRRGYRFIAPVTESVADRPPVQDTPSVTAPSVEKQKTKIWPWKPVVSGGILLAAVLAVVGYRTRTRPVMPPPQPRRAMLAVLPFQNLSNDPAQDYFSDGLTEETITDLGKLSPEHLGVIARTSAMAYKHSHQTILEIGRELGVDYILEGSVRREGDQARVSAQLIRVSDQTHLWAENYDRGLVHLLDVQNDLGRAIADSVKANLTPEQKIELSKARPVNPEAYDLYARGRFYWNQRTAQSTKVSIDYFQQATAKDPDFALAYAGLADAWNLSNILGLYSPRESFPQAKVAATRAISLDPSLAEPHAALGMEEAHYEFNFAGAEREFLKAIELNPNSPYAHLFYSNCFLLPMGRKAQAIAENKQAIELDPLSLPINNFLGMTYLFAGDYASAHQQFEHTLAMDPTFALAHDYFSGLLGTMGNYEQAIRERETADLLNGSRPAEAAARANALLGAWKAGGEQGYWEKSMQLDLVERNRSPFYHAWTERARGYAMAGEKDQAFAMLNKGFDEREGQDISLLNLDPGFRNLHGDPRFLALLQKIGLPEQ